MAPHEASWPELSIENAALALQPQRVPVVVRAKLRVGGGSQIGTGDVIAPTLAGGRQLLDLAPSSGVKFTEVDELGTYWWNRRIPRTRLSAAEARVAA